MMELFHFQESSGFLKNNQENKKSVF